MITFFHIMQKFLSGTVQKTIKDRSVPDNFHAKENNMFEISIKGQFCGSHRLRGYDGPCANLHGHNWEVEVFFRGGRLNKLGMLVDFKLLKKHLQRLLAKLDHKDLNRLPWFKKRNPTAENIAKLIFDEFLKKMRDSNCPLQRVRVSESPGTAAWYYAE